MRFGLHKGERMKAASAGVSIDWDGRLGTCLGLVVRLRAPTRHLLDGLDDTASSSSVLDRAKCSQQPEYLRRVLRLPLLRHDRHPSTENVEVRGP